MKGRKFIAPDGAHYKIASVVSNTSLLLSQPYQGVSATGQTYYVWQDEYPLYPEVLAIGGFISYALTGTMSEALSKNMKDSYPHESQNQHPSVYTVVGRKGLSTSYSTGTVSGTINTNTITGVGTAWLANIQPGYEITIGAYRYHVKSVNSDTEIELYQLLVVAPSGASYSAVGKNAVIVRFRAPSTQQIVSYWYYAKDYPFVNDYDEDWVAEMFPKVILHGLTQYDFKDKNDPVRAGQASRDYEDAIKDMRVAVLQSFTGVRTLGLDIPNSARE
jgi:hypothetical protein